MNHQRETAFPVTEYQGEERTPYNNGYGLTKLELVATLLLAGSSPDDYAVTSYPAAAIYACDLAEVLLEECQARGNK